MARGRKRPAMRQSTKKRSAQSDRVFLKGLLVPQTRLTAQHRQHEGIRQTVGFRVHRCYRQGKLIRRNADVAYEVNGRH